MHNHDIISRLQRGETILLDGGTGSELHRRGVNVSKGASAEGGAGAWSAPAVEDASEVLREIHEDYLRVGADIITANSYNTNRGQLAHIGLAHKMEEFSRRAIDIAREARDAVAPHAFVAGAIAPTNRFPTGWDPARVPPATELEREWGDQVVALAAAGADLIVIESMRGVIHLLPAVKAATSSGLPVFLSVHCTVDGIMESGETMDELVKTLDANGLKVDALLLMCSPPEAISATLPSLRAAFTGPIGAYANIGYQRAVTTAAPSFPETQYHGINIGENTPEHYAEYARQWRAMGAQIIGGCCASTPEHIAALAPVVKENQERRNQ
ncbi:MAG: homocysteine S-methyltransferase family protein [Blastocatellia bacterium]